MGARFERRFRGAEKGSPWGEWGDASNDWLPIPFDGYAFGVATLTIIERNGDRWQYRAKPEPVVKVPIEEMHYRLITRSMRQHSNTDPNWEHRSLSGVADEQLDAIEAILRSELLWGVSRIDLIDADANTWEYILR